jgi:hypothetical protein
MSKEGDYYKEDYAVPEGSREPVTAGSGARQGHRFMIFCCDMRRAVIILDAITISFVLLHLILFLGFGIQLEADTGGTSTFQVQSVQKAILVGLAGVAMPGLGIYGALTYKYYFLALAALYFGYQFFLDLFTLNLLSIMWSAVYVYAHAVLTNEMSTGIMTEENYPSEKYSCCCV